MHACSDNPRVAATLAVPGVHALFRELGFQHLQEASTSSEPADPGMLNLPLRLPGPKEPRFHGALSLLRPAISETPVATTANATETPVATDAGASSSAHANAMHEAPPQTTPATEAAAPVDTLMADVDDVIPASNSAAAAAAPVAEPEPVPETAPAIDWGDGGSKQEATTSPACLSQPAAAPVAAQSEGLGMSANAWKADNKNNPKKAVMIGNVAVPAETARPPAAAGPSGVANIATPVATAEVEEGDEFPGRNTKVRILLPAVFSFCTSAVFLVSVSVRYERGR